MHTVFIVLPYELNADFLRRAGRHLGLPESLHFHFIVRKRKWMSPCVNECKCGSDQNKGAGDRPESGRDAEIMGGMDCG